MKNRQQRLIESLEHDVDTLADKIMILSHKIDTNDAEIAVIIAELKETFFNIRYGLTHMNDK